MAGSHAGTPMPKLTLQTTAIQLISCFQGTLRTQDRVLTSQFQRCQDSIEQLKKQRPWYEVFSDDDDDDDDHRHWEDWEIDGNI